MISKEKEQELTAVLEQFYKEVEIKAKETGQGVFLLYNYKCIGRKYMYLHVYIQFSHALYKQKRNLYISLLFV